MNKTPIEWVRNPDGSPGYSVNPLRARMAGTAGHRSGHYCEKTSPGCKFCYSSRLQPRFGMPEFGAGQLRGDVDLFLEQGMLDAVLRKTKPTRIFWCDMTDLFGEWVPDEWIDRCFATMALASWHTHILVTKRAKRAHDYLTDPQTPGRVAAAIRASNHPNAIAVAIVVEKGLRLREDEEPRRHWPLDNVWLLVSAENQEQADERIPWLLQTPAAVRGVSAEPLLGPIDLREWLWRSSCDAGLDWVIVGGESGRGARPCAVAWVRDIVDQCRSAGVACFTKQLGSNPLFGDTDEGETYWRTPGVDSKGGNILTWPRDLRVRQWPEATAVEAEAVRPAPQEGILAR